MPEQASRSQDLRLQWYSEGESRVRIIFHGECIEDTILDFRTSSTEYVMPAGTIKALAGQEAATCRVIARIHVGVDGKLDPKFASGEFIVRRTSDTELILGP